MLQEVQCFEVGCTARQVEYIEIQVRQQSETGCTVVDVAWILLKKYEV